MQLYCTFITSFNICVGVFFIGLLYSFDDCHTLFLSYCIHMYICIDLYNKIYANMHKKRTKPICLCKDEHICRFGHCLLFCDVAATPPKTEQPACGGCDDMFMPRIVPSGSCTVLEMGSPLHRKAIRNSANTYRHINLCIYL